MRFIFSILIFVVLFSCKGQQQEVELGQAAPLVKAPFEGLDTIASNDWWNRASNSIIDVKVHRDSVIAFGIYTVANEKLKMTAQFFPLYPEETRDARLAIFNGNKWEEIAQEKVNDIGWSALFEIEEWDETQELKYKILHGDNAYYEGLIRKNPSAKNEIKLAALSCNSNHDRGDRANYIRNINHQDPDLVFFAGDQSYDHKEHTAAWLKFGMQFRNVFRTRPCITIPDDHDIGQGNIWGEGGKKASSMAGNDGGYFFDVDYIKMVERCQTSHLPDPYDPTPILQGINVYYTDFQWGNIDFAILEDRKFKSGPAGKIPQQGPRPDHIRNPDYDPASIDLPGLILLGDRQLEFLGQWGGENKDKMKVVLSQTGFCGGAHLHGKKENRLHADLDSNGWPQTGRNKALEKIKAANAIHIGGDQHISTVLQHGIQDFSDGPWAFVVPASVNDYYGRWWWPEDEKAGPNSNGKLPWNGDFLDGFNNKITMHAYANPETQDNGSGYGFVRFNKTAKEITFECWPRTSDLTAADAEQFPGWPVVVKMD